ncbi:MAG: ATP-binding cassette domain-containing protein [Candidatus Micrarchaeia archaeon]
MNAISAAGLSRKFGDFTAVDALNLEIPKGEVFGLLGPNGAGKTTTISMLCTILKPSGGSAKVNGFDVESNPADVRRSIGIVFQDQSLDGRLSAFENMEMHAALYGLDDTDAKNRIEELLGMVELLDRKNDLVRSFSGGMKRRIELARGLLHSPSVLFLDEPTIGLDPQSRAHVWDYIGEINKKQKLTILMTTHYMDEAEKLCDRIGIMDKGKLVALDTPQGLVEKVGTEVLEVTAATNADAKKLAQFPLAKSSKISGKNISIRLASDGSAVPKLFDFASRKKACICGLHTQSASLNDVFLYYTGSEIREEGADRRDALRALGRRMGK